MPIRARDPASLTIEDDHVSTEDFEKIGRFRGL